MQIIFLMSISGSDRKVVHSKGSVCRYSAGLLCCSFQVVGKLAKDPKWVQGASEPTILYAHLAHSCSTVGLQEGPFTLWDRSVQAQSRLGWGTAFFQDGRESIHSPPMKDIQTSENQLCQIVISFLHRRVKRSSRTQNSSKFNVLVDPWRFYCLDSKVCRSVPIALKPQNQAYSLFWKVQIGSIQTGLRL